MGQQSASADFDAAHRALLADPSVQFQLTGVAPPPEAPGWLRALGEWLTWAFQPVARALSWIGDLFPDAPYARILLWTVIAVLALAVLAMAVERVRHGRWRLPRLRRRRIDSVALSGEDEPLFDAAPVRAWLREADGLAALGHFAEAAHLLLFRSVEDLARRRPGTVQPALTARELAAVPVLPVGARAHFAAIAAIVEGSLFGGRPVRAEDWTTARADYEAFALPGSWRV